MSDRAVNVNIGGGFAGMLAIVFITLKLVGRIDWSWWWVLSPLWMPFVLIAGAFVVIFVVLAIADYVSR